MKTTTKILLILLMPILFFTIICVWDPLRSYSERAYLLNSHVDMHYLAASAIKDSQYNSFILGTSMFQNTSSRETEKYFPNTHFANISIAGATFAERAVILKYIAAQKRAINVIIYSFDPSLYIDSIDNCKSLDSFEYLYDQNKWNDYKLYFNYAILKEIFYAKTLDQQKLPITKFEATNDFNRPRAWNDKEKYIKMFGGLHNWFLAAKNDPEITRALSKISSVRQQSNTNFVSKTEENTAINKVLNYCEKNVFKLIETQPLTEFYVVFPPYSRIKYASWYQFEHRNAAVHEAVIRYCARRAAELDNLHIIGYEDMDFLDNIQIYRDTIHYHYSVNSFITRTLNSKEYEITSKNVEDYIKTARTKAMKFNLNALCDKIDAFLQTQKHIDK